MSSEDRSLLGLCADCCNDRVACPGCDALSVHLILTNLAASLGMGLGWRAALFAAAVAGPWALAHFEEYHTGKAQPPLCMHCTSQGLMYMLQLR